ncbi:MAG: aminotransferase class I/II-fold pyridoxal phosphate-dependent enzyme [Desulfurococcales archaeon]|nr:aminotransferase class I/II-fold pyridoxal phosphate-dependent enzyme [Desulfurococcales archaeon]
MRAILLNQNESPIPPPSHIIAAIRDSLGKLNRYPDPVLKEEVTHLVASYIRVDPEQTVLIPGTDTVIDVTSRAIKIQEYIVPAPSFYDIIIGTFHWNNTTIKRIPLKDYAGKLSHIGNKGWKRVALADNPNNPLGYALFRVKPACNIPLLVDEAYYEYSGITLSKHVRNEEDVGILRTFSKAFGLASLRIGALAAPTEIAEEIRNDPLVFRITTLSLIALKKALEDPSYALENARRTNREKEWLKKVITRLKLKTYDSYTNFITIDTRIPGITEVLAEKGIIVKSLEKWMKPGLIRVTIGTHEENLAFLEALEEIIIHKQEQVETKADDDRLRTEQSEEPCEA